MPSLIISTNEDGTASVAPFEAAPEMLQGAEQFPSIDEAVQAAGQALSPQDPAAQPEEGAALPEGAPLNQDEKDASLEQGFARAKRGL